MKLNIPGLDLASKYQMHPAREKRGSFQKLYQSSRVVEKWFLSRLKKSRRDTKLNSQLTRSPFISSAWSVQREPWKKEKRQVRNTELISASNQSWVQTRGLRNCKSSSALFLLAKCAYHTSWLLNLFKIS